MCLEGGGGGGVKEWGVGMGSGMMEPLLCCASPHSVSILCDHQKKKCTLVLQVHNPLVCVVHLYSALSISGQFDKTHWTVGSEGDGIIGQFLFIES